jgi:hypothetical protein
MMAECQAHEGIGRKPVLGGLINEYSRAACGILLNCANDPTITICYCRKGSG